MSSVPAPEARVERNADATRMRILEAAFREIYRKGFQGMRLDEVLQSTGLTKGALYHHFPNKLALGYAVVDEVIATAVEQLWLDVLRDTDDPLTAISGLIDDIASGCVPFDIIEMGCPLNNLAQEMSPLDEGFRVRIDAVFRKWTDCLADAIGRGRERGTVKPGVNSERTAIFIIAVIEGCIGMAKNAQSLEQLKACSQSLKDYFDSLRVQSPA